MEFQFDPERTLLGTVSTWPGGEEDIALSERDRLKHVLLIGKSGRGKTTVMKNMAIQDLHAGRGLAVIDPHGDLSRELLDHIPSFRARDLVYIDPSDTERVVTFNILACVPPERIAATTSTVVGAFKAVWADSWGPRLERILYNAVAALIEAPNTSLIGLPMILKSEHYRARILKDVADPMVQSFFSEEFNVWRDDWRAQVLDPVLNKVEQLLASPVVRCMLGTVSSSIDFTEIMNERKVLIANLGKGTLGPGHAHLLGAMLVSGFASAAMARAATPVAPEDRAPFYLLVDEFQNFASDSFAEILSELRKQGLGLTIGHQFLEQVPHQLRAAVLGNVGSIVCFEVSSRDAQEIAPELGLKSPEPLTAQGEGEAWAKHASHGGPYHPRLLPPIVTNARGRDAALAQNRLRHTFPRERVEMAINAFLSRSSRQSIG